MFSCLHRNNDVRWTHHFASSNLQEAANVVGWWNANCFIMNFKLFNGPRRIVLSHMLESKRLLIVQVGNILIVTAVAILCSFLKPPDTSSWFHVFSFSYPPNYVTPPWTRLLNTLYGNFNMIFVWALLKLKAVILFKLNSISDWYKVNLVWLTTLALCNFLIFSAKIKHSTKLYTSQSSLYVLSLCKT